MSKIVDDRVVSLEFDNKRFESNVSTTLSTLDKLKEKLNLPTSAKAFENISKAANKVDLNGINTAVDTMRLKFNALDVAAVTALTNITNTALETGKKITKALTIEPVLTGFQEYETQINAVQTILANTESKGTTLEQVNAALDELNTYADQTIYNFTQMTKNIGTFTAAGVGLEKSVTSIKGIANLAAISGSNAQQASTAMYQLSQALAAGRVSLMDWNSVVNAGMGGEVFQNALKRTAENFGYNVDAMIAKYGSFRESLTQGGWLTAEVLTETLTQLSGAYTEADLIAQGYTQQQAADIVKLANTAVNAATDVKTFTQLIDTSKEALQSGWTQTWELIFGDFEQAKTLWSGVSKVINDMVNASSEARNKLLEGALKNDSWNQLSKSITDVGVSLDDFQNAAKEAARENGIAIDDLISKYGSFEGTLKEGWLTTDIFNKAIEKLTKSENAVGNSTEALNKKFEELSGVVNQVIRGDFGNGAARMQALAAAGYDYAEVQDLVNKKIWEGSISVSDLSDKQLENIGYTEDQIKQLRALADQASKTGTPINELMDDLSKPSGRDLLIESAKNIFESIGKVVTTIKDTWDKVFPAMESDQLYGIIEGFHNFTQNLILSDEALKNLSYTVEGLFRALEIGTLFLSGTAKVIKRIITSILNILQLDFLGFTARIGQAITAFRNWLLVNNSIVQSIVSVGKQFESFLTLVLGNISKWIQEFAKMPFVASVIENISNSFNSFVNSLNNAFDSVNKWLESNNLFVKGFEMISPHIENAIEQFTNWIEVLKTSENLPQDIALGIVEFFSSMIDSITSKFKSLNEIISTEFNNMWKSFKDWINGLKTSENLALDIFNGLFDGIKYIGNMIANAISSLFNNVNFDTKSIGNNFVEGLISGIQNGIMIAVQTVIELGNILLDKLKSVLQIHSPSRATYEIGYNVVMGLANGIRDSLSFVGSAIASLIKVIIDALGDVDLADLMLAGGLGGILYVSNNFAKALQAIAKPFESFAKIEDSVAGVFKSISGYLDAKKLTVKADAIYTIAKAIAILSGSLMLISLINPERLWQSVAVLGILVAALGALSLAISRIQNVGDVGKVSVTVISLGVALLAISKAVQMISEIDPSKSWSTIKIFAAMCGGLIGSISILSKINTALDSKSIQKLGTNMIKFAISIGLMALAIKMISGIETGDLIKSTIVITIMGGLLLALTGLSKIGINNTNSVGTGLLKMAASFVVIATALKMISKISDTDLSRGLKVIAGISALFAAFTVLSSVKGITLTNAGDNLLKMAAAMTVLTLVMKIISGLSDGELKRGLYFMTGVTALFAVITYISKQSGFIGDTATLNFLAMSGAMFILAATIKFIANMEASEIIKGIAFMTACTILFKTVGVLAYSAGEHSAKAGLMFMQMAVAMGILVIVIRLLRGLEVTDVIRGIAFISACSILFTMLVAVSHFAGANADKAGTMLMKMAVPIGVLAASIALLSLLDVRKVFIASAAMSAVVGMLGIAVKASNASSKAAAGIIAMGVIIGELAYILNKLSKIPIKNLLASSGSLSMLLLSLSASMALISVSGTMSLGAIPGLIAMSGAVALLAVILGALEKLDISLSIQNATSLSILLLAMAGVSVILAGLGTVAPTALTGALAFDGVVAILGGLILGIGALMTYIPEAEQFLNKGIDVLSKLFNGIGQIFGNLISGFIGGVANSFPIIANKLSEFMTNLQPFLDGASSIDPEAMKGISELAKAILILTGADVINSLIPFIGENSLAEFGEQLAPFGESLKEYSDSIKGVDSEAISNSAKAAKALVEVADAVPNEGGWLAALVGDNSLSTFAEKLAPFAENIKIYAKEVEGLNVKAITDSTPAIQGIVDIAKMIPNEGGWLAALIGDNDFGTFGANLESFGNAVKAYANAVTDLNTESISNSIPAIKSIVEVANSIPNTGGWLAAFTGDNDFGTFASNLESFGTAVKNYANEVSGISNYDSIINSIDAAQAIVNLAKDIPNQGGLGTWIDGDNTLEAFAQQIPFLGTGINGFVNNIGDTDLTVITNAKIGILDLIQLINSMGNINIDGVSNFVEAINILATMNIEEFTSNFSGSVEQFVSIGTNLINGLSQGMTASASSVYETIRNIITTAASELDSKQSEFSSAGEESVDKYSSGIKDNQSAASTAVSNMAKSASEKADDYTTSFYNAGADAAKGFANGISEYTYLATAKAAAMAQAAEEKAKEELDINSPSKVFRKIGKSVPEGFAQGISSLGNNIKTAVTGMSTKALDTTRTLMASIYEVIESGEHLQPTITPVMDLSNIQTGVGNIDSLLNSSAYTFGVASSLDTGFNSKNQNGQTELETKMVQTLASIRDKIDKLSNSLEDVQLKVSVVANLDGEAITDSVDEIHHIRDLLDNLGKGK